MPRPLSEQVVVVTGAAVTAFARLDRTTPEEAAQIVRVNLLGPFYGAPPTRVANCVEAKGGAVEFGRRHVLCG